MVTAVVPHEVWLRRIVVVVPSPPEHVHSCAAAGIVHEIEVADPDEASVMRNSAVPLVLVKEHVGEPQPASVQEDGAVAESNSVPTSVIDWKYSLALVSAS